MDDLKRLINGEEVQPAALQLQNRFERNRGSLPAGKGSDVDSGRHTRLEPRLLPRDSAEGPFASTSPALPSLNLDRYNRIQPPIRA